MASLMHKAGLVLQAENARLRREAAALRWALCNALDGTPDHHLAEETGLSDTEAAVLAEIRRRAHAQWAPDTRGEDLPLNY